jgi:hypothetical protein
MKEMFWSELRSTGIALVAAFPVRREVLPLRVSKNQDPAYG